MHQAQPKEGHKIWLTQEADAKSWSSLKHVQPKEGRKELAPREIKFRYRRLDTAIRERAGSSQERRKRAKDTPGYLSLFLFLFIPNYSRCSRRVFAPWKRRESPMVQNTPAASHFSLLKSSTPVPLHLHLSTSTAFPRSSVSVSRRPGRWCPLFALSSVYYNNSTGTKLA